MKKTFSVVGSAKYQGDKQLQYVELKNALNALGLEESNTLKSDLVIFVNYSRKFLKKVKKHHSKRVLIRLEPKAVLPVQYKKRIEKSFDLIITPGGQVDTKSKFIGWPYKYDLNPSMPTASHTSLESVINESISKGLFEIEQWNKRKNTLVLIAANKVSPTSNSNYKLRRRIAKQMSVHDLDTYGPLWNTGLVSKLSHRISVGMNALKGGFIPNLLEIYGDLHWKYPTYIDEPTDKHQIIQQYRYSLVAENSSDYCSEKLFDVVINGSVPIYVGPRNFELNLPDGMYFSCDGSLDNLKSLLNSIRDEDIVAMLAVMQDFIQSEKFFTDWASDKVYENIACQINKFWNQK